MGNSYSLEPFSLKEIRNTQKESKQRVNDLAEQQKQDLNNKLSQINNGKMSDSQLNSNLNNLIKKITNNQTETSENKVDLAKQKYITAKNVAKNAPEELRKAKRDYFIEATGSKQKWTNVQIATYKNKAKQEQQILIDTHKTEMKNIRSTLNSYKNNYNNKQILIDYINKLKKENNTLKKELDGITSKVSVNQRKVWYETNQINNIDYWKIFAQTIYIIIVVIYIGFFFYKKLWKINSKRNHYVDISLLIFFIIWPFISNSISILFIYLINWFLGKIPIDPYGRLYRDYSKDYN